MNPAIEQAIANRPRHADSVGVLDDAALDAVSQYRRVFDLYDDSHPHKHILCEMYRVTQGLIHENERQRRQLDNATAEIYEKHLIACDALMKLYRGRPPIADDPRHLNSILFRP